MICCCVAKEQSLTVNIICLMLAGFHIQIPNLDLILTLSLEFVAYVGTAFTIWGKLPQSEPASAFLAIHYKRA